MPQLRHILIALIVVVFTAQSVWSDTFPPGILEVQEEGTKLNRRTKMNFIGGNVTAEDDSTNKVTKVTVGDPSSTVPTLTFTDTTASEDDFEFYADASAFYLTNTTDDKTYLRIEADHSIHLPQSAVFIGDRSTNPVLTFDGDAGTDATITWDSANDQLEINGGSVGIGTVTPSEYLEVSNASTANIAITSGGAGNSSAGFKVGKAGDTANNATQWTRQFDAHSSAADEFHIDHRVGGSTVSRFVIGSDGSYVFNETAKSVDLRVEGATDANLLFVDGSADKIGIGTSSPLHLLHLGGSDSPTIGLYDTDVAGIPKVQFGYSNTTALGEVSLDIGTGEFKLGTTTGSGYFMTFYEDGNERMRIDSSGNVGIGTSTPGQLLDVSSAAPVIAFTDTTASEDDFEIPVEASTFRIVNTTDNITSLIHYADNAIGLGEPGKAPSFVRIVTDGTGDSEVQLPNSSIGISELDSIDTPADGEAFTFDSATGRGEWKSSTGDVSGPASSTDNAVARFDGTGGKTLQNSGVLIDDSDAVSGVATIDTGQGANELYDMDQNVLTTSTPTFAELTLSSASPVLVLTDSGGDNWEIDSTTSVLRIVNNTDNVTSLMHRSDNSVALGEPGKEPLFISFHPSTLGDDGILLPASSVGGHEIASDSILSSHIKDGEIANADISSTAAIDLSKTSLIAGTNITLSTNTLNVDDAFLINSGDDTTSGTITATGYVGNLYDASGAVDLDIGSADVTDVTATTDGGTVVLDGTITMSGLVSPRTIYTSSSGDAFETVATSSGMYSANTTDGIIAWHLTSANALHLGEAGNEPTHIEAYVSTTGDSAVRLPANSIGGHEINDASTTNSGDVELSTSLETTNGTSTTTAITPDSLAGSYYGIRVVSIIVLGDGTDMAVADGSGDVFFRVPSVMDGYNLVNVAAHVQTAGTTGTADIQIHNVTDSVDMLSTKIQIETGEKDSKDAGTQPVINGSNDDVATGDEIRVDVDAIHTTAAKGLLVELQFQKP